MEALVLSRLNAEQVLRIQSSSAASLANSGADLRPLHELQGEDSVAERLGVTCRSGLDDTCAIVCPLASFLNHDLGTYFNVRCQR